MHLSVDRMAPGFWHTRDEIPERSALPTSAPLEQPANTSGAPAATWQDAAPADHASRLLRGCLEAAPRVAVYGDAQNPPVVVSLPLPSEASEGRTGTAKDSEAQPATGDLVTQVIDSLSTRAFALAKEQGGGIPLSVFRELIDNLVHASFAGVVVTLLDAGNTVRVSDHGPGIPDKEAALRPGFTSADANAKLYIRGVGSGFSLVTETLAALGGTLEIDNNLGMGTVVTARIPPPLETPLAPAPAPAYNLSERQLKVLMLTVELAPVGPTRIAQELGVSTSTAYRDLVTLEQAGFVVCRPSGHRSATDTGLAYLKTVL